MTKIIPSIIQDNGEYYINIEEYKIIKELGEHYKHLYSEVKKQKDKAMYYIENELQISVLPNNQIINGNEVVKRINKILSILKGETNE